MNVPGGVDVGACSHTGLVRGGNEDDYLIASAAAAAGPALLAAIADGMGGVAGGAEASRTALRALAASLVDGDGADEGDDGPMTAAFRAASARVFEAASAVPALRDMGTTLTAAWIAAGRLSVGHVGDTRLYRVRGGVAEPLTSDHAVRAGESLLTRCVGGGQLVCEVDVAHYELAPGDRIVLATDGVWNVVGADELQRLVGRGAAQEVAERLVQRALDHGGPDNATCLVVDVEDPALAGAPRDVDLPRFERPEARALWPAAAPLRAPAWPWLLLAASALVLVYSTLTLFGVDVVGWFA